MKKLNITVGLLSGKMRSELAGLYPVRELDHLIYMVIECLFGYSKTDLILRSDEPVILKKQKDVEEIIRRMKNHEPIQHIINKAFFMGIQLKSDHRALIPRQETEELVGWIMEDCNGMEVEIADIGTGSGCISIILAKELSKSKLSAIDVSHSALDLAKENARLHDVELNYIQGDILRWRKNDTLKELEQQFDVIVSNPPYIQRCDAVNLPKNVLDYDPEEALFVNTDDPLVFYRAIANWSLHALKPGGSLYLEVNERFGKEVTTLLLNNGYSDVILKRDLHDKDRMIRCKFDPLKS
jgi:release factor glutamine methyltransferase